MVKKRWAVEYADFSPRLSFEGQSFGSKGKISVTSLICSTYCNVGDIVSIPYYSRLGVQIVTEQDRHRLSFQSLLKFIAYGHWWLVVCFSGYCSLLGDILIISLLLCFLVSSIKSNQRFCSCALPVLVIWENYDQAKVFRCFLKKCQPEPFYLLESEMICCSDFESSA